MEGTTYSDLINDIEFPTDEDEKLWRVKTVRKETVVYKYRWLIDKQ